MAYHVKSVQCHIVIILLCTILLLKFDFLHCNSYALMKHSFNMNCSSEEYFSLVQLKCMSCPNNTESNLLNPFHCSCRKGFHLDFTMGKTSCKKCSVNQTTSNDGLFCMSCGSNQSFNTSTNTCEKCPRENMIVIDNLLNESNSSSFECFKCSDKLIADKELNKCVPCHVSFYEASKGKCICPKSTHSIIDGICALKSNLASIPERNSSHIISFRNADFVSKIFSDLYKISAYSCNFLQNATACQVLANLCVLLHYSYENELSVCSYYRDVFGKKQSDLPAHVPLLYYDANSAKKILESKFDALFCLNNFDADECNTVLNITVAKYSMNGSLISWQPFYEIFSHCSKFIQGDNAFQFGTSFYTHCQIPMNTIYFRDMEFYELYIHTIMNNKRTVSFIPILNMELRVGGSRVNYFKIDKWQFTKRFFILDVVSGRTPETYSDDNSLKILRYAELMELVIQPRKDSIGGIIYLPYLRVYYNELSLTDQTKSKVNIIFRVKYSNISNNALKILGIINGIGCGFCLVLALLKAWSLSKRCGTAGISILFRFICLLCGYTANSIFFFIFLICGIWFLIFRNQDIFWIYLPDDIQEKVIEKYIISAFCLKIIHIFYIIYTQITVNLFLIDWEQPKLPTVTTTMKNLNTVNNINNSCKKNNSKYVSIWRTYFIANEWNELQTYRKVNVTFVLFVMLFYLKVLRYEDVCRKTVQNHTDLDNIPYAFISRFTVSVFLFTIVSFIQVLFKVTIFERYVENKLQMFVDLCSMANISVLIFKHRLYGFYIHGRSVYGESDLNMQSLYDQLKREEEDLCQRRGLEPSSECQTFEVRVTQKFRQNYDSILEVFEDSSQSRAKDRKENSKRIERCIEAHEQMKTFLTIFLQHGLKGLNYIIKDKYFLENTLDLEFQEPKEQSLFFRDHFHTFDKVLMSGKESSFLTFEVMTFVFVDLFATDFILASIVTYLVHRLIKTVRYRGGKRNVIDKTLVDERFLI